MSNYYKQFQNFKENYQKNKKLPKENIPISVFQNELMKFYGFGGRNKTLDRWCSNFRQVGYISIERDNDSEVDHSIINWVVNFK